MELFSVAPVQTRSMSEINEKLRIASCVSFFAGCGGMDLGFKGGFKYLGNKYRPLPFDILAAYDNSPQCVTTYNSYFPGGHASIYDLANINAKEIPSSEILLGGFPCQDFSSCGPQRGLKSVRGRLYLSMVKYMETHKPKIVVGENVPHLARLDSGDVLNTIISDLEAVGYKVNVWKLKAVDYGIPQDRVRLFIIAVRNDIPGFPETPKIPRLSYDPTIDWAISDLESVTDESIPNQSQYFLASKAKRGNGQGDEHNVKGRAAYTIRANAKSRVHFHYKLSRRLTMRECARLQTFPDDFKFPHSATTNLMQIGNAVPPVLAHYVANSISEFYQAL